MWSPAPRPDTRSRWSGQLGGARTQLIKPSGQWLRVCTGTWGEQWEEGCHSEPLGSGPGGGVRNSHVHAQLIKGSGGKLWAWPFT